MRILITGSRKFTEIDIIRQALVQATAGIDPMDVIVIQGEAAGADTLAKTVAQSLGFHVDSHPAIWRIDGVYNPKAGPERNLRMIATGADVCLAFPQLGEKNIGTNHCIREAKKAGIPVQVFQSSPGAAVIDLPQELSFVALDFETANSDAASIIQVGVSKVIRGVVTATHTRPVLPDVMHRRFAPGNTRIHGLRSSYIVGAMSWPERLAMITKFAGALPLIAHNVTTERNCIRKASAAAGITPPDLVLLCSLKMARRRLPEFPKHGLGYLTEAFGITDFTHHDAGEDARATALAILEIARRTGATTTAELFAEQVQMGAYTPLNDPLRAA